MNISLGGAVSPSTKRARSRRMPGAGGSAAANRDVALSRVGRQVRRPWGDRAPALSLASARRLACYFGDRSAATGQVNQTSHAIGRVELDAMVRNQRSEMDR